MAARLGGTGEPSRPSAESVYGSCKTQALRPCVAAYSLRAPGTMVTPTTSTIGNPLPATPQSFEPFGRTSTLQSFETYRSPLLSCAMPVAGKSGNAVAPAPSRLVQVASPVPPFALGSYF